MSSATVISSDAEVRRLDRSAQNEESATARDVQDPEKLARLLQEVRRKVARLDRRFSPRLIDFEDVAVGAGGASVTLRHGFGGRARWYIVGWRSSAITAPILREDTANTDGNTLVLQSYVAGTATIRVEEAG